MDSVFVLLIFFLFIILFIPAIIFSDCLSCRKKQEEKAESTIGKNRNS